MLRNFASFLFWLVPTVRAFHVIPVSLYITFCYMPSSRTRRQTLAKISEESMTVDERQPLLRQVKSREEVYDDVVLPEQWSFAYKWGLVALLAFTAFTV